MPRSYDIDGVACRQAACLGALALVAGLTAAASAQSFDQRSLVPERGIRSHPDPAPAERYRERANPPRTAGNAGAARPAPAQPRDEDDSPPGPRSTLTSQPATSPPDPAAPRSSSPLDQPPYGVPSPGEEGVAQEDQWLLPDRWHDFDAVQGEYLYTCDTFLNTRGGLSTNDALKYIGSLDLVFNIDLEKLAGWRGGRFFFFGENVHGRTLTPEHIGDFEFYDEFEPSPRTAPFTQVTEYWLEQKVGERLTLKVGKQDANRDFIFPEFGVDFINSSFSLIPTILPPTYPNTALGLATFYQASDLVMLRAAVYDGAFFVGHPQGGGQWGFESLGRFGAMSLYETQLRPQWRDGRLPGNYRLGGWHHTHKFPAAGFPGQFKQGNFGLYVSCDQMLYRENPSEKEDLQGLGCFIQYGYAPYDRNTLEDYVGGGLLYDGPFPGRDEDTMGLAVGHCLFSRNLRATQGRTTETSIELFYKAHIKHWLRIQPEVQYICNPGGLNRDALLTGVRVEVAL